MSAKPPVPECDSKNKIAEEMDVLRSVHCSKRRTTSEYVMLCLIGFGAIDKRDGLMRVLQWSLEPLLLYSSFIKDPPSNEFEAILVTKKQVVVEDVEEFLALFNMGICCIQLDSYMQPDMVTCISRIHHLGKHLYGSFKSKTAARIRRDFYAQYGKDQRAKEIQRVLDVTGMTFTPRNMLALHDRINTLQSSLSRLERQVQSARVSSALDASANANLAHAYRRLQASGALPATARVRSTLDLQVRVPPVMLAPLAEEPPPPPPPMSPDPIYVPSSPDAPPIRVVARPPPTGDVFVYVVRD
jgi:hypothetical protein